MKTYIKNSGSLVSDTDKIKIYSSVPTILTDIANNEVIIADGAFYQKKNGTLECISSAGGIGLGGTVGDIVAYYGTTNPDPDHLIICDGRQFSQSDFPALYSLLGTDYVPDLTDYHLKGIGESGTDTSHDTITLNTKVANNYPNHTHNVNNPGHTHSVGSCSHCHCTDSFFCKCCWMCGIPNCCSAYYVTNLHCGMTPNGATKTCTQCVCCTSFTYALCCKALCNYVITCPSTAAGYSAIRYGSENKPKDKTVLFLMRGKV